MSTRGRAPRLQSEISAPRPKTDPQGWLVLAIITVVVIGILIWIIASMWVDSQAPEVFQRCNPGLCKFNIFTGVKTCPVFGDPVGVRVSAGAERCTSRDYCQVPNFQCAVQLDQSVSCDGICGPGNSECRCVRDPTDTNQ